MDCTSCNNGELLPNFIEGQFPVHTCTHCEGNWIFIFDYIAWLERNADYEFADNISFDKDLNDNKKAIICPVSGNIMIKFRISSSHQHRLDYSSSAGGIWLDKGEWDLLKKEGLAGSLHSVITTKWQSEIRKDNSTQNFTDLYKDKFGEETYLKAKEFRAWLNKQPQKSDLRAYVFATDPY